MKQRRYLYLFSKVCFYFIPYKYFHVYFLIWHYYKTPLGHCCFTIKLHSISGDSGYFRLAGACHEYSVASLNMKNFTSPTPRNCVRKALIFALNDSAEALVSLSSK